MIDSGCCILIMQCFPGLYSEISYRWINVFFNTDLKALVTGAIFMVKHASVMHGTCQLRSDIFNASRLASSFLIVKTLSHH